MATLEQIQGGSLVPDFSQGINTALKVFGTGRERAKEAEEQRLAGVVSGSTEALRDEERGADPLAGPTPEQQNEALLRLSALNPQAAQVIRGNLERNDRNALKQIALETEQSRKNAVFIQGAKDFAGMRQRITTIADQKRATGQSVEGPLRLLAMSEGKLKLEMESRITQLTDAKTLTEGVRLEEERDRVAKLKRTSDAARKLLGTAAGADRAAGFTSLIQAATQNNNPEAAAAFQRVSDMEAGPQEAALRGMVSQGGGDQFLDLTDAEGNIIGRENLKTGKKELFTAAQRGLPTGTETPKEPILLQIPILGADGQPVLDAEGNPKTKQVQSLTSFDPKAPAGKKWTTVIKDLGGEIISKTTGRTAEASDLAAVDVAKKKTLAVQKALIETTAELEKIKKRSQSVEGRLQSNITDGLAAVKTLPNLRRTAQLLNTVKTGGFAVAKNAMERFLGLEGADEAELNQALKKQVLSQLKATFGSQFTEKEGDLLADVEANFGKSTGGNIRLINRGIALTDLRAQIGESNARTAEDAASLEIFKRFQNFNLDPAALAVPVPEAKTEATAKQKARLKQLRKKHRR